MKARPIGYLIFFGLSLVACLVLRFPDALASHWLSRHLPRIPGYDLSFPGLSPLFPNGFRAQALVLRRGNDPVLRYEDPRIRLQLLALLKGELKAHFKGALWGGTLSGTAHLDKKGPLVLSSRMEGIDLSQLNLSQLNRSQLNRSQLALSQISPGQDPIQDKIQGRIQGGVGAKIQNGTLAIKEGEFTLDNLQISLQDPPWGIRDLLFSKGKIQFHTPENQKTQGIKIQAVTLTGPQVDVTLSGRITPAPRLEDYDLDLWAKFTLHPQFFMDSGQIMTPELQENNTLEMQIEGNLGHPRLQFRQETGGEKK